MSPRGGAEVTALNFGAIRIRLMREAREALEMALDQCLRDAKKHAPVRDVFAGTSHGRSGLVPAGAGKWSRARRGSELLVAERGTRVIRKSLESQRDFLEAVRKQSWPRRRYEILEEASTRTQTTGGVRRFTSHPRDFDPVLRDPAGELRRMSYGFRDISDVEFEGGRLTLPSRITPGQPSLLRPAMGPRSRPEVAPSMSVTDFLSAKGQRELARQTRISQAAEEALKGTGLPSMHTSGREGRIPTGSYSSRANSPLRVSRTGETTLGGRLRDEIYRTSTRDTGKTISGWVVSPTPYAKYQEYGTSRHRPQPYMRPALYRSRGYLMRMVKDHLGRKTI